MRLAVRIDKGLSLVSNQLDDVSAHIRQLHEVNATLQREAGTSQNRRQQFDAIAARLSDSNDTVSQHMAKTMKSFAPGLFAGQDDAQLPEDNLDLERFFRQPKGHERRIHGHAHAGVRIVRRGATLVLALDAHGRHPAPFSSDDLAPWLESTEPKAQQDCTRRSRVMRRARSTKERAGLLAELEARANNIPAT